MKWISSYPSIIHISMLINWLYWYERKKKKNIFPYSHCTDLNCSSFCNFVMIFTVLSVQVFTYTLSQRDTRWFLSTQIQIDVQEVSIAVDQFRITSIRCSRLCTPLFLRWIDSWYEFYIWLVFFRHLLLLLFSFKRITTNLIWCP